MIKNLLIYLIALSLFLFFPKRDIYAVLRSNLKDPNITKNSWLFYPQPSCQYGGPSIIWHFNGVGVDGTPCQQGPLGQQWNYQNGRYDVTLSLDNTSNSQRCNSARNYYGFQSTYPVGSKKLLYLKDLTRLVARVTISVDPATSACEDPNIPICQQNACPADFAGKTLGWTTILIGIPMYDETNQRNLWLEISPYWTKNAVYGGPSTDPYQNRYLFYGENNPEELQRIMITYPLINKPVLVPGNPIFYELELVPLIRALPWGKQKNIDWNKVHLADIYVGTESWGWALTNFKISNLDLLYDDDQSYFPGDLNSDGQVDVFDYNLLITDFGKTGAAGWIPADINSDGDVDIFDYNILVGNFGKTQ